MWSGYSFSRAPAPPSPADGSAHSVKWSSSSLIILGCTAAQRGQRRPSVAAAAASASRRAAGSAAYRSRSTSSSPHLRHTTRSQRRTSGTAIGCSTAACSRTLPRWPGHSFFPWPHVVHGCLWSSVPMRRSYTPPLTGAPLVANSSYPVMSA